MTGLANRAGLSRAGVSRIEAGQRQPGRDSVERLASAFGLQGAPRTEFFRVAGYVDEVPDPLPEGLVGLGGLLVDERVPESARDAAGVVLAALGTMLRASEPVSRVVVRTNGKHSAAQTLMDVQGEITAWGEATFPTATPLSTALHLAAEVDELVAALQAWPPDPDAIQDEIADVLILALQVAGRLGVRTDLAIQRKMAVNRGRAWRYDPSRGYSVHTTTAQSCYDGD
jgi:NTP pyrophosphatase (non-canonical NTP hydrolase)/transcriptional regulator with XRE-family HTH domain